jgi:hypothetical protein
VTASRTTDASRLSRRQATRRRGWPRVAVAVAGAVLLFALGVALGLALDDRPVGGGTVTYVRTLEPLPQQEP